jgi:hypothetical protein
MKTKTYTLTMLVLIIHVVVISQPANLAFQRDKNFVLGYSEYTDEERKEFSAIDDPSELLIRAEDLIMKATTAEKEPYFENGKVLNRMSENSNTLLHQADKRKLAAEEIRAYNNRIEFRLMKEFLMESLSHYNQKDAAVIIAKDHLQNALRANRSAALLREESYAQATPEAVLGNLKHAEDLENSSMIKIVEAMKLLEKLIPQDIGAR